MLFQEEGVLNSSNRLTVLQLTRWISDIPSIRQGIVFRLDALRLSTLRTGWLAEGNGGSGEWLRNQNARFSLFW
jgi:hypothetical protein